MARAWIPTTVEELSPQWLTQVLRETGLLKHAAVRSLDTEILGEGEGFVGCVARLRLRLDGAEPAAPATLIAKLPTQVRANRAAGELLGAYEREILFYEELAPQVRVRAPRRYYAAMDPNPGAQYTPAFLRFVERLPEWLLVVVLAFFGLLVRFSRRRYLLLLEDLAPARLGDQVAGCDLETARRALGALARVQASVWGSPVLEGRHWLHPLDVTPRIWRRAFRSGRSSFAARHQPRMSAGVGVLLDWLDANGVALTLAFQTDAPATLVHGDYRLDNLFFEPGDGVDGVRVVDWQGAARGPGVYDAAYFIAGSLAVDLPEAAVQELLAGYHAELLAQGVTDYGLDACLRDYQRALLLILQRFVTVDALDLGEARGAALLDAWMRRLDARLAALDPDRALGSRAAP